jgi:hypothetical protein
MDCGLHHAIKPFWVHWDVRGIETQPSPKKKKKRSLSGRKQAHRWKLCVIIDCNRQTFREWSREYKARIMCKY